MEKTHNNMQELTKEERLQLFKERYPEQYIKSLGIYKFKPARIKKYIIINKLTYEEKEKIIEQKKQERKEYYRQYRLNNIVRITERQKYLQSLKPKKTKKIRDEFYYEKKRKKINERQKQHRLKNPEKYRIRARNRYWRDKENYKKRINKYLSNNKESVRKQQKEYALNFPEKTKARYLYSLERIKGNIKNLPCEKCGAIKTHAHHDDYNFPLQVRYLCPKHHHEFHREHIYDDKTYTYIKKNDIIKV